MPNRRARGDPRHAPNAARYCRAKFARTAPSAPAGRWRRDHHSDANARVGSRATARAIAGSTSAAPPQPVPHPTRQASRAPTSRSLRGMVEGLSDSTGTPPSARDRISMDGRAPRGTEGRPGTPRLPGPRRRVAAAANRLARRRRARTAYGRRGRLWSSIAPRSRRWASRAARASTSTEERVRRRTRRRVVDGRRRALRGREPAGTRTIVSDIVLARHRDGHDIAAETPSTTPNSRA